MASLKSHTHSCRIKSGGCYDITCNKKQFNGGAERTSACMPPRCNAITHNSQLTVCDASFSFACNYLCGACRAVFALLSDSSIHRDERTICIRDLCQVFRQLGAKVICADLMRGDNDKREKEKYWWLTMRHFDQLKIYVVHFSTNKNTKDIFK